jgi:hydroxymethylbilane synthase
MAQDVLRIGTRASQLALWQANWVADALRRAHADLRVELVEIKTRGDRDRETPLAAIGGTGVFTKEIQRALLEGMVDVAVHSLKDLPTQPVEGLTLGAVPRREDAADALIAPRYRTIEALPSGAKVGTGSLRRRAQLLHAGPDLEVVAIRGNVETRLAQALDGRLDAVVLALAGLRRLGLEGRMTQRLGPPEFLSAVGQGALGLECRAGDRAALTRLVPLEDPATRAAVQAERRALADLEGGCLVPLGAWGRAVSEHVLMLDVDVFDPDGRERLRVREAGRLDGPDALGDKVAQRLRDLGAERLLRSGRGT